MDIKLFTCNLFSENSYLITTQDVCLLVDPGFYGKGEIEQLLDRLDGRVPGHPPYSFPLRPYARSRSPAKTMARCACIYEP